MKNPFKKDDSINKAIKNIATLRDKFTYALDSAKVDYYINTDVDNKSFHIHKPTVHIIIQDINKNINNRILSILKGNGFKIKETYAGEYIAKDSEEYPNIHIVCSLYVKDRWEKTDEMPGIFITYRK